MDNYTSLWNRLLLRAPGVGAALAQDLVLDAYHQFCERREWSWLTKTGCLYPNSFLTPGTVSVVSNSPYVTGVGTSFTTSLIGNQFRTGGGGVSNYPTYTVVAVVSTTLLVLDKPWTGPSAAGTNYMLFQCYFPMPADFKSFYSVVNTTNNYKLWTGVTQAELDLCDPQRIQFGPSWAAAFYDYSQSFAGSVGPVIQAYGIGAVPVSTTIYGYSYPISSVYQIVITAGSTPGDGTLTFQWRQDAGSWTTGVAVPNSNAISLSNGVSVYFPVGVYVAGNVFVIQCTALTTQQSSTPRYELWPRPVNAPYVYPYIYIANYPEVDDVHPTLPPYVGQRGDVILEMALAAAARFPGARDKSDQGVNTTPYFDLKLSQLHAGRAETLIYELEKKDEDVAIKDMMLTNLPWAPAPWADGSWQQSHAYPLYAG